MTERSVDSVAGRTTAGVAWSTAQKWVVRLTGFATVAILARILGAADFGLVAAASTVIPLLYLLSDLGFATFVVQAEQVTARMLDTAFWFAVGAGAVLAGALALSAPLVEDVLHIDGLGPVLAVLSTAVLFVAAASVPTALLRRRMAFRALAIQAGIAALVAQVVAVSTALSGWGAWALVAQLVTNQAVACVLAWRAAAWRPGREFSGAEFRTMSRFGTSVVGVELVALARSWAETAIITLGLGVTGLGYLNIAQRLVDAAKDLTVAAVMPVAMAAFARIRTSAERLRRGYLDVIEVTYSIAVPFVAVLVVGGPYAVPVVFGDGWSDSVLATQALAVATLMVVGAMVDHALFYGTGRPASWLAYSTFADGLTVAATALCVRFGVSGIAFGFVGVAAAALAARSVLVARLLGATQWAVALPFLRAAFVTACCVATPTAALALVPGGPDLFRLVVVGAVVLATFLGLMELLLPQTRALAHRVLGRLVPPLRRPQGEPGTPKETVDA